MSTKDVSITYLKDMIDKIEKDEIEIGLLMVNNYITIKSREFTKQDACQSILDSKWHDFHV